MKDSKKIRPGRADILILFEILVFGLMTVLDFFLSERQLLCIGLGILVIASVVFIVLQIRTKYGERPTLKKVISILSFTIGNAVWIPSTIPEDLNIYHLLGAAFLMLPMLIIADNKDKEDKKEKE